MESGASNLLTRLQRALPRQGRRARAAPPRWRRPPLGEGAAGDSGGFQIRALASLGGMPKRLRYAVAKLAALL